MKGSGMPSVSQVSLIHTRWEGKAVSHTLTVGGSPLLTCRPVQADLPPLTSSCLPVTMSLAWDSKCLKDSSHFPLLSTVFNDTGSTLGPGEASE